MTQNALAEGAGHSLEVMSIHGVLGHWIDPSRRTQWAISVYLMLSTFQFKTQNALPEGAGHSLVVMSIHGALGHWIDPSWRTQWAISCSCQHFTTGVTKAVLCC